MKYKITACWFKSKYGNPSGCENKFCRSHFEEKSTMAEKDSKFGEKEITNIESGPMNESPVVIDTKF